MKIEKDWATQSNVRAVVLMGEFGARCGYVGVPKGHPLYGASYYEPHSHLQRMSPEEVFDVHGGITYSGSGDYPVESDLWWFGYDCNHAGDAPAQEFLEDLRKRWPESPAIWSAEGVHRSLEYCVDQCESLAGQLAGDGDQYE